MKRMLLTFFSLFNKKTKSDSHLREVERILNYNFQNTEYLNRALTHRSILPETGGTHAQSNEQLEFLGDAVLELVVVEYLCSRFPNKTEGELSKIKSVLVSGRSLQRVASRLKLGDHILMSENEAKNGGRSRSSILEDTMEAIVAALYLDGGYDIAKKFVQKHILIQINGSVSRFSDGNHKSTLLEQAQAVGLPAPVYRVVRESGPDHAKKFEVEVIVGDSVLGFGEGPSKKVAQQKAASIAVNQLLLKIKEEHIGIPESQ